MDSNDLATVATYKSIEGAKSTSSSSMWIAIIALVLAIIAILILIVWAISYAATGTPPGPRTTGCRYNIVKGITNGAADSFFASGCAAYQSQNLTAGTTLTLTVRGPARASGQYFLIDNTSNSNDLLVRGDTGISVTGNSTVPAGTATEWYWSTDISIVMIQ